MGNPTIIDLAARLGISKTTVADALKGSGRVSEETRERVQKAALEIGYVSNRAARQLRGSKTGAIALYVPPGVRNMSFYMPFALGVADQAAEYGYDLTLIAQRPSGAAGVRAWSHFEGVIIVDALVDDPVVQSLMMNSVPVVTAGRVAGFPDRRVRGIIEIQHAKMCTAVLDGMASLGVTNPALISPEPADQYSWSRQIIEGYGQWCASRRVTPTAVSIPSFPSNAELEAALRRAVSDERTDAIIFGWQDIAVRAEAILTRMGYHAGENLELASLVSSQENFHDTYIAGLDLRPNEFGHAAAKLLREVIESPEAPPIHRQHEARTIFPKLAS